MGKQATARVAGGPDLSRQQMRNPAILPQRAVCDAATDHTRVTLGTPKDVTGHYDVSATLIFGSRDFVPAPVNKVYDAFGFCGSGVDGNSNSLNARKSPGLLRSISQALGLSFELRPAVQPVDKHAEHGKKPAMDPINPRTRCGNLHTVSVWSALGRILSLNQKTCIGESFIMKNIVRFGTLGVLALALSTAAFADGAATYAAKCKMCHGDAGLGDSPAGKAMKTPSFKDPAVVKASDADLIATTTNGKGKMPAYTGKLSGDEISAVVKYIRTLQK